jgi:hypothetical protein
VSNLDRTMAAIAKRYDERRESILESIRQGKVSASMSGIEYYDKPWNELDASNFSDLHSIMAAISWNGERHTIKWNAQ